MLFLFEVCRQMSLCIFKSWGELICKTVINETWQEPSKPSKLSGVTVITLPERRARVKQLITRLGWPGSLVENRPLLLPLVFDASTPRTTPLSFAGQMHLGQAACAYSHWNIYKKWSEAPGSSMDWILICEDDIEVRQDPALVNKQVMDTMREVPSDADIVFFGRCLDDCKDIQRVSQHVIRITKTFCTHAYAVTRRSCKALLAEMPTPITREIDGYIALAIMGGRLKAYGSPRPVLFQDRKNLESKLGHHGQELTVCEMYHDFAR